MSIVSDYPSVRRPPARTVLQHQSQHLLGRGEGELMERRSRRGKLFYSCNRYPDCKFASWDRPIPMPCPLCQAPFVVEKTTKRAGTVRRCIKEGCDWEKLVDEPKPAEVAEPVGSKA